MQVIFHIPITDCDKYVFSPNHKSHHMAPLITLSSPTFLCAPCRFQFIFFSRRVILMMRHSGVVTRIGSHGKREIDGLLDVLNDRGKNPLEILQGIILVFFSPPNSFFGFFNPELRGIWKKQKQVHL